jgi:hypothetical protein
MLQRRANTNGGPVNKACQGWADLGLHIRTSPRRHLATPSPPPGTAASRFLDVIIVEHCTRLVQHLLVLL